MVPDLYMQSHFEGTLDYMINDKFGITGGAVHEFNPIKGHWETTPVFGPVIHLKKNLSIHGKLIIFISLRH